MTLPVFRYLSQALAGAGCSCGRWRDLHRVVHVLRPGQYPREMISGAWPRCIRRIAGAAVTGHPLDTLSARETCRRDERLGHGHHAGPILGAHTGGHWLTEYYTWRWCFTSTSPWGFCRSSVSSLRPDNDIVKRRFDARGFAPAGVGGGLLRCCWTAASMRIWFDSPEIQLYAIAVVRLHLFVVHNLTSDHWFVVGRCCAIRSFVPAPCLSLGSASCWARWFVADYLQQGKAIQHGPRCCTWGPDHHVMMAGLDKPMDAPVDSHRAVPGQPVTAPWRVSTCR